MRRYQTLGNYNKDAMLDCNSGSYQSEDKRNCHVYNYVTFIMIIIFTFIMFLLKLSTIEYIICWYFSIYD